MSMQTIRIEKEHIMGMRTILSGRYSTDGIDLLISKSGESLKPTIKKWSQGMERHTGTRCQTVL